MTWTQSYTPVGNLIISALIAALPVVVLLGALALFHIKAHWAALLGLASALLVAFVVYGMPLNLGLESAAYGAAYGLFPIGWIVLCAIFVYDITVYTGKFEIVKHTIAGLSSDRRIQLLLIGFSFGAFIEGAAGFGTPVAISAAMLIGLGFRPLQAAGLALIGNTAPVAFGALGTPVITLAAITKLPLDQLSSTVGRTLTIFSLIIPFWLIWALAGRKAMMEVWPACLTTGGTFAIVQLLVSNLHGPWLVAISASLASIVALVILLRFWQPQTTWRFDHDADETPSPIEPFTEREPDVDQRLPVPGGGQPVPVLGGGQSLPMPARGGSAVVTARPSSSVAVAIAVSPTHTRREALVAWMPWVLLSVLVFIWGIPDTKTFFNNLSVLNLQIPELHKAVFRAPPVVLVAKAEDAIFTFNWVSATGTGLFVTGILSGLLLGLSPLRLLKIFGKTLYRVRFSLLTIAAMLGLGYTTRYGGLDATMGLAFASTGAFFAFFSPLLGWLGVALTGSDTSSNVLFGNLQQITAQQVGISPVLTSAANSAGGVMGKMIDAQSIVVAGVATNQQGQEGNILRYVFFHSLVLAALVGLVTVLQAYVFTWMIP